MISRFSKILSVLLFAFLSSFAFGEEFWYISIGAYDNLEDAKTREKLLTDNGINAAARTFEKNDYSKFYRVLYTQKASDQDDAMAKRSELMKSLKELGIDSSEVWITAITENIVRPAPVVKPVAEPAPAPVVVPVPVVIPEPVPEPVIEKTVDFSKRTFSIRDSDDGLAVENASIVIDEKWTLLTDNSGNAVVPAEIPDGDHIAVITCDGYVTTNYPFTISNSEITSATQVSIPKAVDFERIKIILDWGATPQDLDAHCYSKKKHVYHVNKKSGNLILDRDDTDKYGPETITIQNPQADDVYRYVVHNYSNMGQSDNYSLSRSGAKVQVYFDNEYVQTFFVPIGQPGTYWHVFDIVNKNEIVPVEIISNSKNRK